MTVFMAPVGVNLAASGSWQVVGFLVIFDPLRGKISAEIYKYVESGRYIRKILLFWQAQNQFV